MIELPFDTFRPPPEYIAYVVNFKDEDIHPIEKIPMRDRFVRIYAPGPEQAKEVVKHRFGKAFFQLWDERTKPGMIQNYKLGIYEQLIWKKV